jgi:hypothetical protein
LRKKAPSVELNQQGLKPDVDFAAFAARVNSCPDKKLNPNRAVNWVIQVERIRQFSKLASATRRWRVGKFAVTIAHEISFLAGRQRRWETKKKLKCKVYKTREQREARA